MKNEMALDGGYRVDTGTDRPYIPRGDNLDKRINQFLRLKREGRSMPEICRIMCPEMDIFEKDCEDA